MSDNYLFVPNAVLKSMCMIYHSPSLCYIDSLCNWHMNIKRSDEVCNILSKSVKIENNSYKRHGFQVFGSDTGFCHNVSCAISPLAFLFKAFNIIVTFTMLCYIYGAVQHQRFPQKFCITFLIFKIQNYQFQE